MSEIATGTVPAVDADAAKYAALAKELDIEPEVQDPEPAVEPEKVEPEPADPPHVPRAEHENVQKALREARAAEQAAKAEKAAILQIIEQARAQRPQEDKKEPPKVPAVEEDPIAHYNARLAQLEAQLQQQQQGGQMTAQQLQAWQQQQALHAAVQASDADIRDQRSQNFKPDYDDACDHIRSVRMKQLDLMFPDAAPQAQHIAHSEGFRSVAEFKQRMLANDEIAVAVQALQMGVSPSLRYYELALAAGYQPKAAKPNGKDVSLADKAKEQLAAAKRGQGAALTLSGGNSGRKGAEDMAIADLAELFLEDADAADKIWDQMAKAGKLG
jgi:hypothetical protein